MTASCTLIILLFIICATNIVAKAQVPNNMRQNDSGPLTSINLQDSVPPLEPAKIFFQEIAGGLINPVFIANAGDGSNRIFVVERAGRVRIIKNGILLATPFLDIHSLVKSTYGEQGLLSLVFHPLYDTNGIFYVIYTAPRQADSTGSVLIL